MFAQIMEGRAADADGMRRLMAQWMDELKPGATGFLGTTAGVTADGRTIAVARFESEAAARANSDRPEQGEWWAKMETCFDGEVTFTESSDVELFLGGGSNDAGFVQIMKGTGIDRAFVAELDKFFERHAASWRPDVIGAVRVWTGPDSGYDVTYFTSEAAAREGETKPPPPEMEKYAAGFEELMANTEYIDISDPWLY